MFILLNPSVFMFLSLYVFFCLFLFFVSSFFFTWVVIEIIIFLFMGVGYCMLNSNYSSLISYFLIQSTSSFLILVSYHLLSPLLQAFSLLLKLSIFPFLFWFVNVSYGFPSLVFFISATAQKLPLFMILKLPLFAPAPTLIWGSVIVGGLFTGSMMLAASDFRIVLTSSSLSANSWLFVASFSPISHFAMYFFSYSLSLFVILSYLSSNHKPNHSTSTTFFFMFVNISALPPSPLFLFKLLIIFNYAAVSGLSPWLMLFLATYCITLVGYYQVTLKHVTTVYLTSQRLFL